ncbi:hypothetical protein GHU01_05920 [Proteus mirabilis]|nr:hypothetical protein [Proteus mirabilis]
MRHTDGCGLRSGKPRPTGRGAVTNLKIDAGLSAKQQNTIRQQGFAIRHEPAEGIPGAQSISCPVFNKKGEMVVAALTMGFIDPEKQIALGNALKAKMAKLSQ